MAAGPSHSGKVLDLKSTTTETERGDKFWNSSVVAMKFQVEGEWLKKVRDAKGKPDFGMRGMDGLLEEVVGNKIELAGPLIDFYLKQIGQALRNKLSHSKATGLMNPVVISVPWCIYRHILVLVRGYSGDVQCKADGSKHYATISSLDTASKLLSPGRFCGECVLSYRHFKRVPSKTLGENMLSMYNGRSMVAVTSITPLCMDYCTKKEVVTISFYVQRYTKDDFVIDSSLQALMNSS